MPVTEDLDYRRFQNFDSLTFEKISQVTRKVIYCQLIVSDFALTFDEGLLAVRYAINQLT
jgi:hypothetical protein